MPEDRARRVHSSAPDRTAWVREVQHRLSFACPKESNPRKGHPRGRGLPASLPANFASRLRGPLTAHPCAEIGRARILRAPAARLFPAPARRGREGTRKSRARQSLPQKRRIYATRRFLPFALGSL